jgi:hypothetical protein
MKKQILTTLVILCIALIAMSQETKEAFKPHGKPIIRVFSNAHTTFADGESKSAFELTRVYLGYEHFFSENFSGTVIYDVGNPGVGKLQMTAFVKNAFLNYKHNNLSVDFGLIPTTQFKVQENFWGYRYLAKVFQDEYEFASSADLGTSITYKFGEKLSADVALYNGEGYKKVQSDNIIKTAVGLTLNPFKELTIRGMADFMGKDSTQITYAGFVGFKTGKFSLAAEYNYQKNHLMIDGRDYFGPSFYGTINLSKKAKFFARYDDLQSNTPSGKTVNWNLSNDGQLIMAGVEYSPVSGIKLSPNYRGWNPANETAPYVSTLMLNCEIKF